MATKAERFKAAEERKGPKAEAKPKTRSEGPKHALRAPESTGARNVSKHASRKAAYDLEDTRASSARPSRKSTRKSGNRQKHATQLKSRQTMRTRSPRARAEKAQAENVK
jgi:hypothetical protein